MVSIVRAVTAIRDETTIVQIAVWSLLEDMVYSVTPDIFEMSAFLKSDIADRLELRCRD